MIDKNKLVSLYNYVLTNFNLSFAVLKDFGFTDYEIDALVSKRYLNKNNDNTYNFIGIKHLCHYGKELMLNKNTFKALECFLRCLELDPKNSEVLFQLCILYVSKKDYNEALKYLVYLFKHNEILTQDYFYFLYLIGNVSELPLELQEQYKQIKKNDLMINKNSYGYEKIKEENEIRQNVYFQKFVHAKKLLNDLVNNSKRKFPQHQLVRILLNEAIKAKKNIFSKIIDLILNEDFDTLILFINELEEKHNLNYNLKLIRNLGIIASNLSKGGIATTVVKEDTSNFLEAINNNDFERALEIRNKEKEKEKSKNPDLKCTQ